MLIENTDEPMHIYPINFAWESPDVEIEVRNSTNKFFYYGAFEGANTTHRVSNSKNIAIYAAHKNGDPPQFSTSRGLVEVIDSQDVLVAIYNTFYNRMQTGQHHLREVYEGNTYTLTNLNVAFFKRGDLTFTPILTDVPPSCRLGEPNCDSPPDPNSSDDDPTGGGFNVSSGCAAGGDETEELLLALLALSALFRWNKKWRRDDPAKFA
jgi:hypothetical protein